MALPLLFGDGQLKDVTNVTIYCNICFGDDCCLSSSGLCLGGVKHPLNWMTCGLTGQIWEKDGREKKSTETQGLDQTPTI